MDSKEYFEKVMQDYNQKRNGRSLRKYCKDEAIDYDWVMEYRKTYPGKKEEKVEKCTAPSFMPLTLTEAGCQSGWQVSQLVLTTPSGESLEIKSGSLFVVAELLKKMS